MTTEMLGKNALFDAIRSGNFLLLKSLLNEGVPAEMSWGDYGETALHAATKKGDLEMFYLLISSGADINTTDVNGRNALYYAAAINNLEMTEYLSEIYSQTGPSWKEGYGGLCSAINKGHDKIVDVLLAKGVDLKARTNGFKTPLQLAVKRDKVEIIEKLLKTDCDINEKDDEGHTALHFAVTSNSIRIVKMLLDAGADMRIESNKSKTPFHFAILSGNVEMVKTFIDYGADINKF